VRPIPQRDGTQRTDSESKQEGEMMEFKFWLILNVGLILADGYGIFYIKASTPLQELIGNIVLIIGMIMSLFVIALIIISNQDKRRARR
jgi:hypothetical protein